MGVIRIVINITVIIITSMVVVNCACRRTVKWLAVLPLLWGMWSIVPGTTEWLSGQTKVKRGAACLAITYTQIN